MAKCQYLIYYYYFVISIFFLRIIRILVEFLVKKVKSTKLASTFAKNITPLVLPEI